MFSLLKLVVFSLLLLLFPLSHQNSTFTVEESNLISVDDNVVITTDGEVQFSASQKNLLLPNLLRDRLGRLVLNISLTEAKIDHVSQSKLSENTWALKLADESVLYIATKRSTSGLAHDGDDRADIQEYYIVWSTRESGREVCFDLSGDGASW